MRHMPNETGNLLLFKDKCRDPKWGEENCMIDHTVYLANSSGIKIGITRKYQQIHRWMDQGSYFSYTCIHGKKEARCWSSRSRT